MNLIVVHNIVDYEGPSLGSDDATQSRLDEVRKEKEQKQRRLTYLSDKLEKMNSRIRENGSDLITRIRELSEEIEALQAQHRKSVMDEFEEQRKSNETFDDNAAHIDDLDQEFIDHDAEHTSYSKSGQEYSREEASSNRQSRRHIDKEIQKLFRKIAAKTHPDKTKDPELHRLFIQAKACKDNNDYEGLKDIWEYVCGKRSGLLNRLLKLLQEELLELRNIDIRLDSLLHSQDYAILQAYETNPAQILMFTRDQMYNRIRELSTFVMSLKKQMGIYKPPETPYFTMQF